MHVCVRPDGDPIKLDALTKGHKRIAVGYSLGHERFHDLHHTYASLLLNDGVPMYVMLALMGHASIQTIIDTYSHIMPSASFQDTWEGERTDKSDLPRQEIRIP